MAQKETVERILDAASVLFAERGYAETSLRTITTAAGVNLASVNYHFGSKKALIQAVFARILDPFCKQLASNLDRLQGSDQVEVEAMFRCLFSTLMETVAAKPGLNQAEQVLELQRFMRLLGMAYTQSQGHLRRFIVSQYGDLYRRFLNLLRETLPGINPVDFYWQLYFLLGATVFTLSSIDSIQGIIEDNFAEHSGVERALELLIPTLTRMMQIPASPASPEGIAL
ncbi:TetR/AcrR family transcriptional regulator [Pseudoteredinibacter isoporae]|uniref:AcrR family transcriptional regulator n=1 Tax=Pseudoteredinibacter isoporae TaxID=570281 RepID=A0A7X0MW21_9GAMM|nr:TetR/AcrR family transcriptional regulator [Pseudoteredinibacter isoporae]MBB6521730.1 AcrR family transcriptional regulator [Pseudoteredinibacter isoporae]NHO87278.1 TetR/AcrR family transcriptional regulator [Pseudoteredinibacter isoporae]NIB23090.1 TetR/AcrR family transcriptional regulator [Pseudoteredinibacter isoporae]